MVVLNGFEWDSMMFVMGFYGVLMVLMVDRWCFNGVLWCFNSVLMRFNGVLMEFNGI